jgi:poly(A)-specific ribonuclease
MDVTRINFSQVYPALREKILSCEYMSFDEEMTGIMPADYRERNKKIDDPDARFARMMQVALKYGIVQFGLCLFHKVSDGGMGMVATPYNFYLYSDNGPDFSMSASSIAFLRNNNMDFGTWITKGLSYANEKDEAYLRKKFLDVSVLADATPAPAAPQNPIILTKEWDIAFMTKNISSLDIFLGDNDATDFYFEKSNSFLRRVLYQHMEMNHPTLTLQKSSDDRLQVLKLSVEERDAFKLKVVEDNKNSYEAAMGFRLVFNDMIAAKRPIIGHNCMFDLMFMMRWLDCSFKDGNMETLNGFKERLNRFFPMVFDTKFIAISGVLGEDAKIMDSSLGGYKLCLIFIYVLPYTHTHTHTHIRTSTHTLFLSIYVTYLLFFYLER